MTQLDLDCAVNSHSCTFKEQQMLEHDGEKWKTTENDERWRKRRDLNTNARASQFPALSRKNVFRIVFSYWAPCIFHYFPQIRLVVRRFLQSLANWFPCQVQFPAKFSMLSSLPSMLGFCACWVPCRVLPSPSRLSIAGGFRRHGSMNNPRRSSTHQRHMWAHSFKMKANPHLWLINLVR